MNVRKLLNDDRAVSPVIGVILMVAITVILAAVIGTFVLGLGDQVSQTTPNTSFGFDYDRNNAATPQDELTISHNGGETLDNGEVDVTLSGATAINATNSDDVSDAVNQPHEWSVFGSSSDLSAGSSATVGTQQLNASSDDIFEDDDDVEEFDLSGATVRVVWQSSGGDSSAQLGRWDGPDA